MEISWSSFCSIFIIASPVIYKITMYIQDVKPNTEWSFSQRSVLDRGERKLFLVCQIRIQKNNFIWKSNYRIDIFNRICINGLLYIFYFWIRVVRIILYLICPHKGTWINWLSGIWLSGLYYKPLATSVIDCRIYLLKSCHLLRRSSLDIGFVTSQKWSKRWNIADKNFQLQ